MKIMIKNDECGLLFKEGNYVKCLKSGKYRLNPFVAYKVVVYDMNKAFEPEGKNLNVFLNDEQLVEQLEVIEVMDHEIAIHFEEGQLCEVLRAGKYAYWKTLQKHTFKVIDLRIPIVEKELDASIITHAKLSTCVSFAEVTQYEKSLLYFDGVFQKVLAPGRYYFWKGPTKVTLKNVDMRQQQLDMTGQEIMTEDKITLRLNFVAHYKIVDPMKIVEVKNYEEQLYILMQLVLREYVGCLKLDDLLQKKQEIGNYVLDKLNGQKDVFGIEFLFAGVKDVILPGEIKDILNTVLIAEKKAQANVITRREETASTRSLLNTAKLMEENQTLYRLKELEFLEKICDKIGNVSLTGGGGLLEQLNTLLANK